MVRVVPPPLIVMVAARDDVDVWEAAVTVTVLLSDPDNGDIVSQGVSLQLTVQSVLEEIVNVSVPPED